MKIYKKSRISIVQSFFADQSCVVLDPVSQKILRAIVIVNIYQEKKCASQKP